LGVSVRPVLTPDVPNPAPVTLTAETVTFAFPVFVIVTLCELLVSSLTLPKAKLDGLALSVIAEAAPAPVNEIVKGELGALLNSEIDPEKFVAELGVNTALKLADLPAAIVNGVERPVVLKPFPPMLN
jgi:hypothetical protein